MAGKRRRTGSVPPDAAAVVTSAGVTRVAASAVTGPTEESVRSSLRDLVQTAITYVDEEVSPDRAKATQLYKAERLGNEEEGRSQIVMSTVRDSVLSILPNFLRMFFGTERAVEFVPQRPELAAMAEQQSDYVTHLFADKPGAILEVNASTKDGLIRRLGFVKWWAQPEDITQSYEQDGLTAEAIAVLKADPEVTYSVIGQSPAAPPLPDGTPAPVTYRCAITRRTTRMKIDYAAVPPENMFWNRTARSFPDAIMVGERREMTVSEACKLGFDKKEILKFVGDEQLLDNLENIARQPRQQTAMEDGKVADDSTWKVTLYRVFAKLDEDGDGIAELRRYWLAGDAYTVLKDPDADEDSPYLGVAVDEIPYACWTPDPEPHTIEGQSITDLTGDLQRVDTALVRSNLDSAGLAIHSRMAYQEGYVNPHDMMNTEIGAVIRTTNRPADSIMEYRHSYLGKDLFPLMEWMKRIREERTGYNMESQGLNADALQSSTDQAVGATLSAAQARTEMLARFYAEQIMVPLFRGLYRLAKKYRQEPQIVRMNGRFVETDPRQWDDDCEVRVSLMLGGGLPEQKLLVIEKFLAKQEGIIAQAGIANPLVSPAQYSAALARWAQLSGEPDPSKYFTQIAPDQSQQIVQMAAQPPQQKPDPAMVVAEAQAQLFQTQAQAAQAEQQRKDQELLLKQQQFKLDQEMQQEKMRQDFILADKEMELRYQRDLNEEQMQAFITGHKVEDETLTKRAKIAADAALGHEKIVADTAAKIHATNAKPAKEASGA